jgi:hypothetical protein
MVEQLKTRGFTALGQSGIYEKKLESTKGVPGILRANTKSKRAVFTTEDDSYEAYSEVPELAEVQKLLGYEIEKPSMGRKLKEAMEKGAAPAKETAPAKNLPATVAPASQCKPAIRKDFIVGAFDNLPETLVMKMGDKPYVTKAGLNFVGKKLGITVKVEPVRYSFEKHQDGMKIAIFKGIATTEDGREYVDYGIASTENTTQMIVKGGNLDHMASTRASSRALRLATACGYCSVEELPEPPMEVIDAEFTDA